MTRPLNRREWEYLRTRLGVPFDWNDDEPLADRIQTTIEEGWAADVCEACWQEAAHDRCELCRRLVCSECLTLDNEGIVLCNSCMTEIVEAER